MLPICVQYPYRTCIFDLYVSNILTGHVYFETFVRVVFSRSLPGVCLIFLPDIPELFFPIPLFKKKSQKNIESQNYQKNAKKKKHLYLFFGAQIFGFL